MYQKFISGDKLPKKKIMVKESRDILEITKSILKLVEDNWKDDESSGDSGNLKTELKKVIIYIECCPHEIYDENHEWRRLHNAVIRYIFDFNADWKKEIRDLLKDTNRVKREVTLFGQPLPGFDFHANVKQILAVMEALGPKKGLIYWEKLVEHGFLSNKWATSKIREICKSTKGM